MPVPIVYRRGPEPLINYSFIDIVSGSAFMTVYPAVTEDYSEGKNYILSGVKLDTVDKSTSGTSDLDFDITITAPITLDGNAYVELTNETYDTGSTGNAGTTVYIRKYDGSTETTIGTGVTPRVLNSQGGGSSKRQLLSISLTKTYFQKGDILRVTFNTIAYSGDAKIWHDPNNTGTAIDGHDTDIVV